MIKYFYTAYFKYSPAILILFIIFSNTPVHSQSYHVRTYMEDDGLANSKVYGITQDFSGCMWFASRNGISFYDGIRWKTYSYDEGLPPAQYSKIKCDSRGTIWAFSSFANLVAHFDGHRWRLLPEPEFTRTEEKVRSFQLAAVNNQTVVALGTEGSGLYLWTGKNKNNHWEHIGLKDGSPPSINDIAAYGERFYIASEGGVSVLKGTEIDNTIAGSIHFPTPEIIGIAVEKKNDMPPAAEENIILWLMGKKWLGYLDNGLFNVVAYPFDIPRNDFNVFLQPDSRGGLFFGNIYDLFHTDKNSGSIQCLGIEQGLIADGASGVYIDREKNIWVSSFRGVSKIAGMRFANYRKINGLLSDEVTAVWEIEPGGMVFGHNDGITFFKDNRFRRRALHRIGIKDDTYLRVMDIHGDRKGNTWVAAPDLGLAVIAKNNSIRWYDKKEGLAGQINSVLVDTTGNVWAGTSEGVFILQGKKFRRIEPETDVSPFYARKLFPGPGNSIYVATSNAGVFFIDKKKKQLKQFLHAENKDENNIYSLLFDSRGQLWVGSKVGLYGPGAGEKDTLVKFNKGGFQVNRPVYFIIEDRENRLWFGTDNGVVKWDGRDRKEYTVHQGLAGRETNRDAGFVDSQGRVWIGTDRGVSCYKEEFEKKDIPPPVVRLLWLEVSGSRMSLQKTNKLKHHMNNLIFHISVVSFIDEDALRFQNKLEGFDRDWSAASTSSERQVRYTYLPPGRYRFHLKAANAEGLWSDVISSAEIIILRPFWKEWWFYVMLVLISGLVFYGILVYFSKRRYASLLEKRVYEKTEELRKYQQHLEEMVETRTVELTNANVRLKNEIVERVQAEIVFEEERNRLKTIFAVTPDLLVLMDRNFVYQAVNPAFCQFMGKKEEELIGKTDFDIFPPGDAEIYRKSDVEVMESGRLNILERKTEDADGATRWLQVAKAPIFDITGQPTGLLVSVRDITRRKQAEEKIGASLREKEVLLKEIHHRVKNNLQIISSLLNLQSGYIQDKNALKLFENSRERIFAMALIHEKLYESGDLSRIDFPEYIRSLTTHLLDTYSLSPGRVRLEMQIENVALDIDTSIPLGLIINELVSNALKYAFPDRRKGELRVILEKSAAEKYDYTLIIDDNGIGFPANLEFLDSNSLGMTLVNSLVKKLRGVIHLERENGTKFTIEFKKVIQGK